MSAWRKRPFCGASHVRIVCFNAVTELLSCVQPAISALVPFYCSISSVDKCGSKHVSVAPVAERGSFWSQSSKIYLAAAKRQCEFFSNLDPSIVTALNIRISSFSGQPLNHSQCARWVMSSPIFQRHLVVRPRFLCTSISPSRAEP